MIVIVCATTGRAAGGGDRERADGDPGRGEAEEGDEQVDEEGARDQAEERQALREVVRPPRYLPPSPSGLRSSQDDGNDIVADRYKKILRILTKMAPDPAAEEPGEL